MIYPDDKLLEIPGVQKYLLKQETDGIWYCSIHRTLVIALESFRNCLTVRLDSYQSTENCWAHPSPYYDPRYYKVLYRSRGITLVDQEYCQPDEHLIHQIVDELESQQSS